jgi:dihydrolipoamide dehydrogenase
MEPDGKLVRTYREALLSNVMPKRLLVVDSGATSTEFASFFKAIGFPGDDGRDARPHPAG